MPVLIPHIWVQPTGFGPDMFAGQIMTGDGRQATHKTPGADGRGWTHLAPIRLAPKTQTGLDQLGEQLMADLSRAKQGAA